MPIYEYETLPAEGRAPIRFEVRQRMSDPPLERHPETGEPVQRVMSAAFVCGASSSSSASAAPACDIGSCGTGACATRCGSD